MKKRDFIYYSGKKYDGMMGRCYRPSDRSYKHYGGRGIKVCGSWIKDIQKFREWLLLELSKMGESGDTLITLSKQFQLDRIDSNGHYSSENCRLSTPQTNTRNRRVTGGKTVISAEGEEIVFE